ncbi:hypothetical protein [Haloterrigena turkmenica]|uniref:hypothetical protein n=1 Tax=Haloterrigena turkmenica TaxID=62320 RepID=UPI000677A707|nr:hypothetical protein [Haloterrigena turkmenica]
MPSVTAVPAEFGRSRDSSPGPIVIGQQYPDVIDSLPTAWFDFDLRCLADNDLVADSADPLAGMRVAADRRPTSP